MNNTSDPSMSGLIPERRMDSNGKFVTRWVKDGSSNSAPSAALAASTANGNAPSSVPLNQNWETTTYAQAESLASKVALGLNDPDKLWENFDFYTGMLESRYGGIAFDSISTNKVASSLRDAWLNKHGFTASDREGYMGVGGDEGYEAYREAYGTMMDAAQDAEKKFKGEPLSIYVKDGHYGAGHSPVEDEMTDEQAEELKRAAFRLKTMADTPTRFDRKESRYDDEPEGVFDTVMERVFGEDAPIGRMGGAVGTALEDTLDRHSFDTEVPKDVGGSTIAWSDLNPFKRRKK